MIPSATLALFCLPGIILAQNTAKITGKVTDALTHRPIPNVHIGGTMGSRFVGALTAFDGSYTLEDMPAGKVRMNVSLNGYKLIMGNPSNGAQFTLAPGDAVTRNFEMHPLGRIYGKLVDRDTGSPVDGHPVSALRREQLPGYTFYLAQPADPKSGEFDIRDLEAGDYFVAVGSPDEAAIVLSAETAAPKTPAKKFYGQSWYPDVPRRDMATPIHLGEGETRNLDIAIEGRETHTLSGTVEALGELEQHISFTFQTSDNVIPRRFEMAAPGPFRIENLAPGTYRLAFTAGQAFSVSGAAVVLHADVATADYQVEITDRDVDNFKAVLQPGGGVSGEVRMLEEDAKLPEKMAFMLVSTSGWFARLKDGGALAAGQTAFQSVNVESGRFHQEAIRPGEYWPELQNLPAGYAVAQVLFTGSTTRYSAMSVSALNTPLTFVLTSHPGAIAGAVRENDQSPVAGATVVLLPYPVPEKVGPAAIWTEESSADGAFAFRDLAPGNYRAVILTGPDVAYEGDIGYLREQAAKADPIEVRAGQSATVSLKH